MGVVLHQIHGLTPPFSHLHERIAMIAPGGCMSFSNDLMKLIYFYRGGGEMIVNDLYTYPLKNGSIVMIPEGDCTQLYLNHDSRKSVRLHTYILIFKPVPKRDRAKGCRIDVQAVRELNRHLHVPHNPRSDLHYYFAAIKRELHDRNPYYKESIERLNQLAIYQLVRTLDEKMENSEKPRRISIIVDLTREYIYKNFHHSITLSSIAFAVNRSQEHLSRQFKKHLGITVFEYIRKVRIEEAIKLMEESSYSLHDIARKTGYQSQSFFSRCFKMQTGVSPREYMNSIESNFVFGSRDHHTFKVATDK